MQPLTQERQVIFMQDSHLPYPDMWLDVFVAGSPYEERQFASMFVRSSCKRAARPEEADLVVFTGGSDVDPALYGQEPHYTTNFVPDRDSKDTDLYKKCLDAGIPMLGICRGAQFLHVMNGGSLYQDVDKHNESHGMYDAYNKKYVPNVSSLHHQMVIDEPDNDDFLVVAYAPNRSTKRHYNPTMVDVSERHKDIEAFVWRSTCCIGIQGHPEYRGYEEFTHWSLELIRTFVFENPDIENRGGQCRLKEEIMQTRKDS